MPDHHSPAFAPSPFRSGATDPAGPFPQPNRTPAGSSLIPEHIDISHWRSNENVDYIRLRVARDVWGRST